MTDAHHTEDNDPTGLTAYIMEKLSSGIGDDRIIPLAAVGEFAYVDTEGCAIYLVTVQAASLVPYSETPGSAV